MESPIANMGHSGLNSPFPNASNRQICSPVSALKPIAIRVTRYGYFQLKKLDSNFVSLSGHLFWLKNLATLTVMLDYLESVFHKVFDLIILTLSFAVNLF